VFRGHRFSEVLPDGKWALASAKSTSISDDYSDILLISLESLEKRVLIRGGYDPRYVPPGYLVFARSGNLLGVPYDAQRQAVVGQPALVASGASMESLFGQAQMSLSDNGLLLYVAGGDRAVGQLMWVDRRGKTELLDIPARVYGFFQVSPRGDRVALHVTDVMDYVWLYDLARREGRKLAASEANGWPLWDPTGSTIAFTSWRGHVPGQPWTIRVREVEGTAAPNAIYSQQAGISATSWSPDGHVVAVSVPREGTRFVSVATSSGESPAPFRGVLLSFSPSGRWVADQTAQSGQNEVWVRSYPDGRTVRSSRPTAEVSPCGAPTASSSTARGTDG
jgi:hypothetical protein